MKRKSLFTMTIFLLSFGSFVFAGSGTTASFLKLGTDGRASGIGGAFTAVSGNINALSYNPAGFKNSEIGFTYIKLVEGINYNFFGFSRPLNKGTLGFAVNYLSQSNIEGRGANRERTQNFGASDTAINMAYSRFFEQIDLGINLKYITSRISDETGKAWAIDIGWQYQVHITGLGVGLSVQNVGPAMKFIDKDSKLPLTVRMGLGYKMKEHMLFVFDVKRHIYDKKTIFCGGVEYSIFNNLFMRAGYLKNNISNLANIEDFEGLRAGFGLKLKRFNLDYAVAPFSDIGKEQTLSLIVGF